MRNLQKEMFSRASQVNPTQGVFVPIRRIPVAPNNRDQKK